MEYSSSVSVHTLRVLFWIGLSLALFFTLPGLNYALPGHLLTLALLMYGAAALMALLLACRKWPRFLGVPAAASPIGALARVFLWWPVSALLLAFPFGLIAFLETRFLWESADSNPQAGLYLILAGAWNGLWWGFLAAVLLTWKRIDVGSGQ